MTASLDLLREAQVLGAVFTVPEPGRVRIEAPDPLPDVLVESLRQFKDPSGQHKLHQRPHAQFGPRSQAL